MDMKDVIVSQAIEIIELKNKLEDLSEVEEEFVDYRSRYDVQHDFIVDDDERIVKFAKHIMRMYDKSVWYKHLVHIHECYTDMTNIKGLEETFKNH